MMTMQPIYQMAALYREVLIRSPRPVFSRWSRAARIPPRSKAPVAVSPTLVGCCTGTLFSPRTVISARKPVLAQKATLSKPGDWASGPFSPKPLRVAYTRPG